MVDASTSRTMSPQLSNVVERARSEPEGRFHSLAHLIDVPALARAYRRMRKDAAVGVDGITKEQYGQDLQANLEDLHARLVSRRYRHQPIRRVHIAKGKGKTRPIGISALEDKLVQDAVRELDRIVHRGEVSWILEADIKSFFDSVDRKALGEMLQIRVADGSLMRLIGKCFHVGVLDGSEFTEPDMGTVQGSMLSPMLGNVYLHYALDLWFEREVRPRLAGKATLIRYCDDFLIAFEIEDDARRVQAVLGKRLGRYGLTLDPDKTRLLCFERASGKHGRGKGPNTFDFLGFTFYWKRSRKGRWGMALKTRSASLGRAIRSVYDWCRSHRHQPVKLQHAALCRRIQGHLNYFGVSGNFRNLLLLVEAAKRAWYKRLCRRSQRKRLNWERFAD